MRAQANFIESAPIVLVLSGLVELARPGSPFLLGAVGIYLLGRVATAWAWTAASLGACAWSARSPRCSRCSAWRLGDFHRGRRLKHTRA
jgi:uncharacterized membrane protein YecN with MAPEG domain